MDNMLSGIIPNDFDRYEEIVNPLKEHLKKIGVDIRENAIVTDIDFENDNATQFTLRTVQQERLLS